MPSALPFNGSGTPVGTTEWAALVKTAYDREVSYQLREAATFRSMIDVRPKRQAMPGDIVVLTRHQDLAVSTTPLSEKLTPDPLAVGTPSTVQVAINEHGDWGIDTLRLETVAFTQPRSELVSLLARHQVDKVDALVKAVFDTGTNVRYTAGRVSRATVAAADKLTAADVLKARTKLRGDKAPFKGGESYLGWIHPDVSFDVMQDSAWLDPGRYVEPGRIYNAEIGKLHNIRFMENTRVSRFAGAGAGGINVYPTYVFGAEAIVEVCPREFGTVIGPVQDPLNRFHPVGYLGIWGASIYRQECLLRLESSSTFV
jgi:N4-gp56 family major capsid protein